MDNIIKDGGQNIPDINTLCKTAASALINWQKSQEEVKEILINKGLNEEEARQILTIVVPTLVSQKKKEAINNIIIGVVVSLIGVLLLWWTSPLRSRAKWVLWALLLLGLRYVHNGIKLYLYKIK